VEQWYEHSILGKTAAKKFYGQHKVDREALKKQKAKKRLDLWWHKLSYTPDLEAPSSNKFNEAKRQRFTPEGKNSRILSSLAALNQRPSITLPLEAWRQVVEDVDLEDQSI
jgi:hypothetical protein